MPDHKPAVKELLDSYDAFLAAMEMDDADMERFHTVCAAINFGAAAYEAGSGHQAAHAMGRAFLLALIDPAHPDLDYLRTDPKSGEVARIAAADLAVIVDDSKEPHS
jgi:hypothetical protein